MTGGPVMFERLALVGIGLIGSSIARAAKRDGLVGEIAISTRSRETLDRARELGLGDTYSADAAEMAEGADLVIVCTPLGACGPVAERIAGSLKDGAIVSDVGSCKSSVIEDMAPHVPAHAHLVPAHPIAGTEHSGPDAGFPELFEGRWCVITPPKGTDEAAVEKVARFWQKLGSMTEMMDAEHHDQVLAITSHLPHLIAYSIVDTATNLEDSLQREVIKFSAGGFRDFTRIAASDPVMWRDVFLKNRDAVLDILSQFSEDLTALRRAIRRGEGDTLEDVFTRTRAIRRGVIDEKQA